MKRTHTLHWLRTYVAIATAFALTLAACHKESFQSSAFDGPKQVQPEPAFIDLTAVNVAKIWYNKKVATKSLGNLDSTGLTPLWQQAKTYGNRVEIPVLFKGKMSRMSTEKGDTNHLGKKRLILYRYNDNYYDSYLVDYIPSKKFTGDVQRISVMNYSKQKFDGKILISNLNNKPIGCYDITNGARSPFRKIASRAESSGFQLSGGSWFCDSFFDYVCTSFAVDEYVVNSLCEWQLVEYCIWIEDAGGGGWSPCNDPLPPTYCDNDPCNDPVPPPSCTSESDDNCTNIGINGAQDIGTKAMWVGVIPLGDIHFTLNMSNININTGTYYATLHKQYDKPDQSKYTYDNEANNDIRNVMVNCKREITVVSIGDVTAKIDNMSSTESYSFTSHWAF
jgi:hypothetical protein